VVVHYAAAGANAPPRADKRPANGVPDYVEKIRNAADAALAFFEKPNFQGVPFQGFETTFTDAAGPDGRLDIYLRGPGRPFGRAVAPTRGQGGAFVELSTSLADRPRDSPKRFQGDAIRFSVAHELFHVVQFKYVPPGMPLWVAEGTANSLAFLFEKAEHPFLTTEADAWLRRPDCALWYEGFNCERCFGGVWYWVTKRHVLRLYFDYLAAHARDRFGVGQGVGALDAAFQGFGLPTMVTPYLYLDFAFTFAPSLAAVAYSRAKRRPPVTMSIVAGRNRTVKRLTLNPLSAHYVGIRLPRGARALELFATGVDGPDPLQTLLLGVRRGATRSLRALRVAREVNPCVVTFRPDYGTFVDHIAVNFRSARERSGSVLVVANRTNRVVQYTLSYRTFAAPVKKPSPTVPWNTPVSKLAPGTFCEKELVGVEGSDPAADAELGAPELTELVANLVTTPSNSRQLISFVVGIPNRRELESNDFVAVWVDTDRNTATGCAPYGAERAFLVAGFPSGPDPAGFGRCVGGEMSFQPNQGTFQARFDEARRRLVVMATPEDLAGAIAFNFRIDAWWRDVASNETRVDSLPDGDYLACFPGPGCGGNRFR
jgi:hypothetical protein